jgi:tetratricopeptide (TPR) repeat protein
MPSDPTGPEGPEGEEEPVTQVVEAGDMVEEPTIPPPAPVTALPPPAPPAAAPPPPQEDSAVEELDAEELLTDEAPAAPPDGVLEVALIEAKQARSDVGRKRRIQLYEIELAALAQHADQEKARLALYQHEIGELLAALGDEGAAVKAYAKALQSDATLKPNLWAIRRVFQARALWPNLMKLLDAEIRFAKSEPERAELLVEKGQLLEDKLSQPDQARDCFERAVAADAGCLAGWMALEKMAPKGDEAARERILRGLEAATHEAGRKVTLLIELASLRPADEALALCRQACAVAGTDGELLGRALDAMERQAEKAARSDELSWALGERAQAEQRNLEANAGNEAARLEALERLLAVKRRQAQVAQAAGDGDAAWQHLSAALEALPPANDGALLARDLESLAETLGRWEALAGLLQKRVEQATGPARAALLADRAEALRKAGRAAEAVECEAEILRESPHHLGLHVAREREALRAHDWDRLAGLAIAEAEIAQAAGDANWAAGSLVRAGMLYGDRLGRDVEAQAALERALAAQPGYAPAIEALDRLFWRAGKAADRAALIEQELEAKPEPARARRLLETLIDVRASMDDRAGAAQAAERLVELRPDDVRVRLRAAELLRTAGRFAEAAEALGAVASKISPELVERRVELLLDRAELYERKVDDQQKAASAYKEVLSVRPGEPRASDALEDLSRRRSGHSPSSGTPISDDKPQPASPEVWDDLAQTLRREAEANLDPERSVRALLKLGEIHERERGNWEDAAQAYRDVLEMSPGHVAGLRGLQRAYGALGDEPRRAQALSDEIEAIEPPVRAEALTLLGELQEDRLRDDASAEESYGRALESLDSPSAPHAALGRFRTVVRRRDPAAIIEALGQLGAMATDGEQSTLLDERAWAVRAGGEEEASAEWLRETLARPEATLTARLQRVRVAARAGDVKELGASLDALAVGSSDPAVQGTLARRAAMLAMNGAGNGELIVDRLRRGHAVQPSDPELLVALTEVAPDPDLLAARRELADPATHADWRVERGEALEARGKLAEAARETAEALKADPRHLPALELYRRLARASGDAAALAAITARVAEEVQDRERSAALWAEAGAAFETLGQRERAAAAFRAVLDRTPLDGAAFNRARALLEELEEERGPAPLVELLTHRLAQITDANDRVAHLRDRAELYSDAGDRVSAERDLREVLAADANHVGAMRRLAQILSQSQLGRAEAIALGKRYLALETADEHRRSALLELAAWQELPGGNPEEAVQHLEAAIELAKDDSASLPDRERLAALYERQRHWQMAISVLQKIVEIDHDPKRRAAVEVRVAQLYKDGFRDPKSAASALMRALEADPLCLEALEPLVSMAASGQVVQLELEDRLEHALNAARRRIEAGPGDIAAFEAVMRITGWRGDEDARTVATQALAIARGETPLGRDDAVDPVKELTPKGWSELLPEEARTIALEMWRLGGEASVKLYGPTPEALGAVKADRVAEKKLPAEWPHLERIARSLGVHGLELYQAKDGDALLASGTAESPALLAGASYKLKLWPAKRYRLGKQLLMARDRLAPLEKIDDEELELYFAALCRVAEAPRPASISITTEARVDERAKAVSKALGRKERKALALLAPRFVELTPPREWRHAILLGACYCGLALSGDLGAAIEAERGDEARKHALTLFALSDEYLAVRRELGLK